MLLWQIIVYNRLLLPVKISCAELLDFKILWVLVSLSEEVIALQYRTLLAPGVVCVLAALDDGAILGTQYMISLRIILVVLWFYKAVSKETIFAKLEKFLILLGLSVLNNGRHVKLLELLLIFLVDFDVVSHPCISEPAVWHFEFMAVNWSLVFAQKTAFFQKVGMIFGDIPLRVEVELIWLLSGMDWILLINHRLSDSIMILTKLGRYQPCSGLNWLLIYVDGPCEPAETLACVNFNLVYRFSICLHLWWYIQSQVGDKWLWLEWVSVHVIFSRLIHGDYGGVLHLVLALES